MANRLRVGMVGYRFMGKAHSNAWRQAPHFFPLKAVVNSPEIDIIDINTPNDSHAEIAIAAAKAGKHILCEKPLALTVAQCQQMLDAVKKAKVVHMVCHN